MEIRELVNGDPRAAFRSGDARLDDFFHRFAGQDQFRHHIGVSDVAVERDVILGYVTASAAQLDPESTTGRGMARYPLPAPRIARLAFKMRDELGCVGLIADAKPGAVGFCTHHDFVALSTDVSETTLMLLDLGTAAG